ncbi:MAG: amidohydrolase family protein [Saprospiraceae bacterium]|nr:amidohydrolase family protein [Saprospiraceae bacterium]
MLIDSNAHVGHWPFRHRKYNTCESLLGRMNQFGVEVSIVTNLSAIFYKNTQTANTDLYEELKSKSIYADRFIPFAVINPIYGGWKDDFDTCINKYGMRGVKLYPQYHGYDLHNPSCIELVKMARNRDLVVAFSSRVVDSRPSSWMDIGTEWTLNDLLSIIRNVPDAKYLFQNAAQSLLLDGDEMGIIKGVNLIIDTSGRSLNNLGELLGTFGVDKFAFGTHSPILDYCTGLLRIEALRPSEATEENKEQIRSGNIRRLLGV